MMYIESCPLWNYEADDTWMVTVRRFFTELWPFSCFWPPKSPFWSRNINFTWHIVETKLSVMKLWVRVYLNHHCTTSFHGDTAVTRHRVIAVFVFLTSESPILEQKYQFHLTHCRNKVVRYEITSPCIFESSLYDNFPRRSVTLWMQIHAFSRNCCFGVEISILDDAL